jgi:rhodanese-related sulfurtransferase
VAHGRIPGSRHVPLGLLAADPAGQVPRDRVIFVCAHGMRSLTAAALCAEAGRAELLSMDEGTVGWVRRGWPLAPG